MSDDRRGRDRRTLVMGVTAIASIVVLGRGVPEAASRLRESSASSREVLAEYARAQGELRALPAVRDSARARRVRLGGEIESLLHGRGNGGLVAALVTELNDDADASHLTVSGIDGRVDTLAVGSYIAVTARLDAVGDVRGVASFVAMIESSHVRLRIVELSLSQSDPAAAPQQVETLRATLVVQGLARRPMRQLESVPSRSEHAPAEPPHAQ